MELQIKQPPKLVAVQCSHRWNTSSPDSEKRVYQDLAGKTVRSRLWNNSGGYSLLFSA